MSGIAGASFSRARPERAGVIRHERFREYEPSTCPVIDGGVGETRIYSFAVGAGVTVKRSNTEGADTRKPDSFNMKSLIICALLASFLTIANAHSYHMGSCPIVQPAQYFQMSKFLGYWYVIQKTSTASKCISYNYTRGEEPGEYSITQDSNHPVLGLTPLKHEYHYTGELSVPEPSTPALMEVRFPLSVAGSASHVVVATDYDNYAVIFTCQKLAFAHRQSATILSRHRDLEKSKVDELRQMLSNFGVDPFELSIVPQTGCQIGNDPVNINVNPNTFSSENIGNIVRKAGEKIGDGVEWVAKAGSKVYHKITGTEQATNPTSTTQRTLFANSAKIETNDVEWIP